MKDFAAKISNLFANDTTKISESVRTLKAIRIIVWLQGLFCLAICCFGLAWGDLTTVIAAAVHAFVLILVFVATQYWNVGKLVAIYSFITIFYTFLNVQMYGWSCGAQQYLIVLVLLGFFSSYKHFKRKALYAFFIMVVRFALYFSLRVVALPLKTNGLMSNVMQIGSAVVVYSSVAVIAYYFSRDAQAADEKLLDLSMKLEDEANRDALTGLPNRRHANDWMNYVLDPKNTSYCCICICDIDHFKSINDTYGHDVGDVVLKRLAQTMISQLEEHEMIARWGGEEFLIGFSEANGDEAFLRLEKIRRAVKEMVFSSEKGEFRITMTFGLAEYDYISGQDDLIKQADNKLYWGKEHGRDRIVF